MARLVDLINQIPADAAPAIKASGVFGGGISLLGLSVDTSGLAEWAQIAANIGIFMGGLAALVTIGYTIIKGRKGKQ